MFTKVHYQDSPLTKLGNSIQNTARPPNILKPCQNLASHKTNICSITRKNLVWLIMHDNYNVMHNIMIYISYWFILIHIVSMCPSIITFTSGCHFWAWPFGSIQSRPCTAKRGTPGSGICQENHFKDLQRLSRAWMPSRKCQTKRPSGSTWPTLPL